MQDSEFWSWVVFGVSFGGLYAVDLLMHRHGKEVNRKWAIFWSVVWVAAGLAFCGFVWATSGGNRAGEFLAAYAIEKSLSLDNLFVFLLIFKNLKVPETRQRKVLSWGIFGALVFRAIFIFAGTSAIERWTWLEKVFGLILFVAAWHSLREDPFQERESGVVRWLTRHMSLSKETEVDSFFVSEGGSRKATRLLVALLAIEITDIVFAIDSVPAALSITRDRFLVYSSNAFAILGLRSLYIVLSDTISRLQYLHYGLAAILAFAGVKMVFGEELHISPILSIGIIALCIGAAVWLSLRSDRRKTRQRGNHAA